MGMRTCRPEETHLAGDALKLASRLKLRLALDLRRSLEHRDAFVLDPHDLVVRNRGFLRREVAAAELRDFIAAYRFHILGGPAADPQQRLREGAAFPPFHRVENLARGPLAHATRQHRISAVLS